MNYGRYHLEQKQKELDSNTKKVTRKAGIIALQVFLVTIVLSVIVSCAALFGVVKGVIDNAPSIDSINIEPTGFITNIYDSNGNRIQKLVGSDANRIYRTLDQIPKCVQNAFIAIEDERFWTHNGIDIRGIFRAAYTGVLSNLHFSEGASTITQQLLKNQVFEGGNEATFSELLQRKIQEQYLAVQLENQYTKKEILESYLNTINLGQNTLGVQAASRRYFDKDVSKLNISEASVIASITKNPSDLNPITNPEGNAARREDVLDKMKEQGYITQEEYDEAMADDVYSRIQAVNSKHVTKETSTYSYFTDEVISQVVTDLQEKLGYSSTQAYNLIYRGGLSIYSTQDPKMQKICDDVIADESMYALVPSKYELTYRITLVDEEGNQHNYDENMMCAYFREKYGSFSLYFTTKKDASPYIKKYRKFLLKTGYTLESEVINYTIEPQVSFVLMDQKTGEIKAIVGGRGEKSGNLSFNRATDSTRQPGSTFKILSTYLPGIDTKGMTLASIFDDAEYNYPGTDKPVRNWDGNVYLGNTTVRQAIYHSMNIVAVKALEQVTPQTAYSYLLKLGFTTIVESETDAQGKTYTDIGYPMALGGLTKGVTNLEITAAYASIANGGIYTKPRFYTKVLDHNGNVLLDNTPETSQVMKETTAWLLTNAMEDVVKVGTGRSIAFQNISLPVAGKTGTTSDNNDSWFVGYTPYLTAGIWAGYDNNRELENTTFDKYIWRTIMERIEAEYPVIDFDLPDTITSCYICTKCGKLSVPGLCDSEIGGNRSRLEYFAKGTEPTENCTCHVKVRVCTSSNMTPSENCPSSKIGYRVFLTKDERSYTADSNYLLPYNFESTICNVHSGGGKKPNSNNPSTDTDPDSEEVNPEEDFENYLTE